MWSADGPGHEPPDEEFYRRMSRPDNEIPVALPLNVLLARTDDAAIALLGLQVYSSGVSFTLTIRARVWSHDDGRGLHEMVFAHGRGASALLLGVEFADGRRGSNLHRFGAPDGSDIVFHPGGGNGHDRTVDQEWWLSPLPPEGPVRLVLSCAPLGIEETTTEVDGVAISRAALEVVTLWPWEPPDLSGGPPPPPDVPDDSWFAGPS